MSLSSHPAVRAQRSQGPTCPVTVVCDDPVAKAEAEFVLAAFEELKGMQDAELKITVTVDRQSGQPEIIYTGIQKKRSLDTLRKVYRARSQGGR